MVWLLPPTLEISLLSVLNTIFKGHVYFSFERQYKDASWVLTKKCGSAKFKGKLWSKKKAALKRTFLLMNMIKNIKRATLCNMSYIMFYEKEQSLFYC